MDFGLWETYYRKILDDFGFERKDDEKTAQVLDDILFEQGCLTLEDLHEKVDFSTKFIVFGAGPSLKEHIKKIKENNLNTFTFTADFQKTLSLFSTTRGGQVGGGPVGQYPPPVWRS